MSEHIGFRCPGDVIAVIKGRMEASGKGRTEVLIEMLRSAMPSALISERAKLPAEAAIYFVWHDQRLLYIGQTTNLKQRLTSHHRLIQFLGVGDDVRISWLPASSENLKAFESSLIEALDPEFNWSDGGTQSGRLVSFRITDEEYEILAALQKEGEGSPSIAAKRIVRDSLGLPPSTSVDSQEIDERIYQALAPLQAQIDELRGKLAA